MLASLSAATLALATPAAGQAPADLANSYKLEVRFDPATGDDVRVPIRLSGDFPGAVPRFQPVAGNVDGSSLSPSGARVAFTARGDLFTVPAKEGEARNLTATPGVRERSPAWRFHFPPRWRARSRSSSAPRPRRRTRT